MIDYYQDAQGHRWWRAFGFQLGWHPDGRRRLLSERQGKRRKHWWTVSVGRRAEVSFCKLKKTP